MTSVRRRTWGVACGGAAVALALVALVVLVSKAQVLVHHPLSVATAVLLVAVIGTIACAREAHRSLT
jgi:hypothetical protein